MKFTCVQLLAGLVVTGSTLGFGSPVSAMAAEKILGVRTSAAGIEYQVESGGCTQKSHFEVSLAETMPVQLRLERLQPDECELYAPYGVLITFSWEELGLAEGSEIVIANPLRAQRVWK